MRRKSYECTECGIRHRFGQIYKDHWKYRKDKEVQFKICVVGDEGIGKDKFIEIFADKYIERDTTHVGVNFYVETISIDTGKNNVECKIQIWDISGYEKFGSIRPQFYRGALGFMLFFDLANRITFENLTYWLKEIKEKVKENIPILLVGNKSNTTYFAISPKEIDNFIIKNDLYYIETSTATKEGVTDTFYSIASLMLGVVVQSEYFLSKEIRYVPIKTKPLKKAPEAVLSPQEISNLSQMAIIRRLKILEKRILDLTEIHEDIKDIEKKALTKKYNLIHIDSLSQHAKNEKNECRVAIAQIGLSEKGDIVSEYYKAKSSGLLGLKEEKVDIIRQKVKDIVEEASRNKTNILLFPEMIIDLNFKKIFDDILNFARKYEMYIIPGSYHDQKTKQNTCIVFGPEGILWRQNKHIPAIIHIGNKKLQEAIVVDTFPKKIIVCSTEYGRIAITICRDFLDMDLRVELKNFNPPVDIVLNPAFTPVTADFKAAHFDARRSIYAYCFFANVAEFGESIIYTPEKDRVERTIAAKEENLIFKDINLFKLRSERKKWENVRSTESKFIQSTKY